MSSPWLPIEGGPPADLPDAELPQANWTAAGKQIAKGAAEAGIWKPFFAGLWEIIAAFPAYVITLLFKAMPSVLGWVSEKVIWLKTQGDPAYNKLVSAAIKDLFETDVDIAGVGGVGEASKRTLIAQNIGDAIMKSVFGDWKTAGPSTLRPTSEPAERLTTSAVRLAFEGWLWDLIAKFVSLGAAEDFGQLDDKLNAALGLGRVVRRCLQPLADTTIMMPLQWKVNGIFRPARVGTSEAIRQYIRGRYSLEKLQSELAMDGYTDEDIAGLIGTHQKLLSEGELDRLLSRKIWTQDQAVQMLRDSGYNESTARTALTIEAEKRQDRFRDGIAREAMDAFAERYIDRPQLDSILEHCGIPEDERMGYVRLGAIRRELRHKDLTVSELEQAVKRGIRSLDDYRRELLKMGYSLEDTQTLEMLLLTDIKDEQAAAASRKEREEAQRIARDLRLDEQRQRRAEAEAAAASKGTSIAEYEALVKRGARSLEQYRDFLRLHGYGAQAIEDLSELLTAEMDDAAAERRRREDLVAAAAKKKISIADLERAVKLNFISVDEYRSQLASMGFVMADRDLLARMLQSELDAAAAANKRRADAEARLAEKQISLPALERAVRLGYRTVAEYQARLTSEGFGAEDVATLGQMMHDTIVADDAARARQQEVQKALGKRKLSLAQMQEAVRAGLQTMTQFRAALSREGFSDQDGDMLARLLQLQVDQAAAEAETRQRAAAQLAERKLSLGDMERAVSLGVVTVQQYKAWLGGQGFSVDDAQVLYATVYARLAATKQQESAAGRVTRAAAKRGVSLADYQKSVRAGLRTLPEYAAWLSAQGFAEADVGLLSDLLSLQLAQDAAAQQRRETMTQELAVRGLSLAQQERAVRAGLLTLDQYAQWLQAQGYAAADGAVLVALLEAELERAAPSPRPG